MVISPIEAVDQIAKDNWEVSAIDFGQTVIVLFQDYLAPDHSLQIYG